jgi:hypothetical protein
MPNLYAWGVSFGMGIQLTIFLYRITLGSQPVIIAVRLWGGSPRDASTRSMCGVKCSWRRHHALAVVTSGHAGR